MKYLIYICCASAVLVAGCATRPCTVQIRGDALGLAGNIPMPPMCDNINGVATSISGTLKSKSADWVVIDHDGREIMIPRSAILLIHY